MHVGDLIMHAVLKYIKVLQHNADAISLHATRILRQAVSMHTQQSPLNVTAAAVMIRNTYL